MQLHLPAFPPDVEYPNSLLNQPRPAARYVEEVSPEGRPGRQFRLENLEEILKYEKSEKFKGLRTYGLYSIGGLLLGAALVYLCGMAGAESLAVGIATAMVLGVGFSVLKFIGMLFQSSTLYPILVLDGDRLYFLNNREEQAHDFGLAQVGELEKRTLVGRHYLLFKLKTDPKRIVPESPAFIWEEETARMFRDAMQAAPTS